MMQRPIARLVSSLPTLSVHNQLCRLSSQPVCRLSASRLTFTHLHHPTTRLHSPPHTRSFHASHTPHRTPDPYTVLGITRTASKDAIKLAYYKLAKEHHPDTNGSAATSASASDSKAKADTFHRIQAAYETLSDPGKKAAYDRSGYSASSAADESSGGGGAEEWNSWYEEMSRGAATGAGRAGSRRKGWMEFDAEEFIHDMFGGWKGYGARQPHNAHTHIHSHSARCQQQQSLRSAD